jgi:putative tryptophan/tyrosine transport system substrate-binding protein
MPKQLLVVVMVAALLAPFHVPAARQAKVHRVGVILQGGPYYAVVDGLRHGLRELGFLEGQHFVLEIRDTQGDLRAVEEAAKALEREPVDLFYTVTTSVTVATKRATATIPIVFCAGTDPVAVGLVDAFVKPGGRLTGVYWLSTDLTGKRIELLKEIVPNVQRIITFYNPANPAARESVKQARDGARQLGVELIERQAASVAELQAALRALRAGDADGYVAVSDAMVDTQAQLLIDTAKATRLPTILYDEGQVRQGGLASYSADFQEAGHLSAKHVQRVLTGTAPKDLPVEGLTRLALVVNLQTAQHIGVTIPALVLWRADKVIK